MVNKMSLFLIIVHSLILLYSSILFLMRVLILSKEFLETILIATIKPYWRHPQWRNILKVHTATLSLPRSQEKIVELLLQLIESHYLELSTKLCERSSVEKTKTNQWRQIHRVDDLFYQRIRDNEYIINYRFEKISFKRKTRQKNKKNIRKQLPIHPNRKMIQRTMRRYLLTLHPDSSEDAVIEKDEEIEEIYIEHILLSQDDTVVNEK